MTKQQNAEIMRWVDGCKQGNRQSQQRLFKHFYSSMYQLCMRYAASTDEAADMLSEGFLKVFSNLDKYESTGSFTAWIKRVMVNAALDYRRKYDPPIQTTDLSELQDTAVIGFDENAAVSKLSSEEVIRLIQQLPPSTRMVFNLFVFEGYSHAEIGQKLNITEGTSAWHVNSARTRLKNAILRQNNVIGD